MSTTPDNEKHLIESASGGQTTPDFNSELEEGDPFVAYLGITTQLFNYFLTKPGVFDSVMSEGGYVTLDVYRNKENRPLLSVDRRMSRYVDEAVGIQDTITVNDLSLLDPEFHGQHLECNFELNMHGDVTKNANLGPTEEIRKNRLGYFSSFVKGFKEATLIKGSTIHIGHSPQFVSDGSTWVPYVAQKQIEGGSSARHIGQTRGPNELPPANHHSPLVNSEFPLGSPVFRDVEIVRFLNQQNENKRSF